MPWCPICRNEYKEGYKTCADCGAPLVNSIEDIDKISIDEHNHDNIKDSLSFIESEEIAGMDDNNAFADILDGKKNIFGDEDSTENNSRKAAYYKPFIKASDRAEEYKSSAYALLFVGSLGLVFLFLCLLNVIPLRIAENIRVVGFVSLLVMFVVFIIVGVKSLVEAKTIDALSDAEDALSDSITDYFKEKYSKDAIDELALSKDDYNLNDEMKYFKREEVIRGLITSKFGDLDSAFLDNETERIFNQLYEG